MQEYHLALYVSRVEAVPRVASPACSADAGRKDPPRATFSSCARGPRRSRLHSLVASITSRSLLSTVCAALPKPSPTDHVTVSRGPPPPLPSTHGRPPWPKFSATSPTFCSPARPSLSSFASTPYRPPCPPSPRLARLPAAPRPTTSAPAPPCTARTCRARLRRGFFDVSTTPCAPVLPQLEGRSAG